MRSLTSLALPLALLALISPSLASPSSEKLAKFTKLARKSNGLLQLNSPLYDEIVAAPRNYSVSVVYTALGGKYGCAPCRCAP